MKHPCLAVLCSGLLVWGFAACTSVSAAGSYPPAPQPLACGEVDNGIHLGGSVGATSCFYQAYLRCQTATLVYRYTPLDTSEKQVFTIHADCSVTDVRSFAIIPGNPDNGPFSTYTCRSVQQGSNAIVITGCGTQGDVTIPTP